MSVLYVDTSALVKAYISEAGTERMLVHLRAAEAVASSVLVWPETLATFARRSREGLMSAHEHADLRRRFHEDYQGLVTVDLDARVLELVDALLLRHPLRSADAAHLASACFLAESGIAVAFACADRALLAAAIAERLPAFDPADGG